MNLPFGEVAMWWMGALWVDAKVRSSLYCSWLTAQTVISSPEHASTWSSPSQLS